MIVKIKANRLKDLLEQIYPMMNQSLATLQGRCVLFKADKQGISFSLQSSIGTFVASYKVDDNSIEKMGELYLDGKDLYSLLSSFNQKDLEITTDDTACLIKAGKASYRLLKIVSEVPNITIREFEVKSDNTYNLPLMQEKLSILKNYMSSMNRPALSGIYIAEDFMVACNGYQGSRITSEEGFKTLNGATFNEPLVNLILSLKNSKEVTIIEGETSIYGQSNGLYFNIIKNEAEYPIDAIKKIFSQLNKDYISFKIDASLVNDSLKRLLLLSSNFKKDEIQIINIQNNKDELNLTNSTQSSSGQEVVAFGGCSDSLDFNVDGVSFRDSLKYFAGGVTWYFKPKSTAPIFLSDNYLTQFFSGLR